MLTIVCLMDKVTGKLDAIPEEVGQVIVENDDGQGEKSQF